MKQAICPGMSTLFADVSNHPNFIVVKNTFSQYTAISKTAANLCGWKNVDQGIGKTDYQVPAKVSEIADQFIKLDKEVIKNKKKIVSLDIGYYADGWNIFLDEKTPMMNGEEVIGVYCNGINITELSIFRPYLALHEIDIKRFGNIVKQKSYVFGFPNNRVSLTKKEEVCLFFLIRGKTAKEIAKIRGISYRTIEDQIKSIKEKMNCSSRSELIDKAINNGYACYFPMSVDLE